MAKQLKKSEWYEVIHPLLDAPEEKRDFQALGPIKMSRGVKMSLLVLRVYLVAMALLLFYHVLGLAGVVRL